MTDKELQKQQKQADQKRQQFDVAKAYETVFGVEGKRSVAQQKVWDDLEVRCLMKKTTMQMDSTGAIDTHKTVANEGCRSILLQILRQLDIAQSGVESIEITVER